MEYLKPHYPKLNLEEKFRTIIINDEDFINNESLQSIIEKKFNKEKKKEFDICRENCPLKNFKTEITKFPRNLVFHLKKNILKDYPAEIKFETCSKKVKIYEPYAYLIRIPYSYEFGHYKM